MKPIHPAIVSVDGLPHYRVPPQKKSLDGQAYTNPRQTIAACKDAQSQGEYTRDGALNVFVTESVYPGTRDESIKNKWIYVFRGGDLTAEAHAISAGKWDVGYHLSAMAKPEDRKLKGRSQGYVRLDGGPRDNPYAYQFFVSPTRLTPKGMAFLLKHLDGDDAAAVTRSFNGSVGAVAVPDPFRWACDAHRLFYQPALDHYYEWVFDEQRAARLFIAGVLKSWIDNGDPANVKKHLEEGQPDQFLQVYKSTELARRTTAEVAMAYVAHSIQGPEHRAVELSAEEAQGEELANEFCQWAAVTFRATETAPGRQFLADVMAENDRLPRAYIFTEHPKTKGFEFHEYRFAGLAALAVFEQIVPAWIKSAKFASVPERAMLKKYLEHLGVKTLDGRHMRVYRNLKQGEGLSYGFGKSTTARRKFTKFYEKLLTESKEFKQEFAETLELKGTMGKFDKFKEVYEPWLQGFKISAFTVVEIANFVIALDSLIEAKGNKDDKVWSLVGASADLSIQACAVVEEIYVARTGEELTKVAVRQLAALGGALAFVSGACDMREFAGKAGAATGQNDYGQAVGQITAAAGAAAVALGGGMALAWALSGEVMFASAAGGPIGLIVGAIGSVIIIAGCVLVAWLRDNHYQSFAKLCCFGEDHDSGKTVYFPWAPAGLGGGSPLSEAKVLRGLLANFVVQREDSMQNDTVWLTITPGYLPANSVFEIWYSQRAWDNRAAPAEKRTVAVSFEDDDMKLVDPDRATVQLDDVKVDPNDENVIRSFKLSIFPAKDSSNEPAYPANDIFVRLNIEGGGEEWTPKDMCLVKAPFAGVHLREYKSLDTDSWVTAEGERFQEEE